MFQFQVIIIVVALVFSCIFCQQFELGVNRLGFTLLDELCVGEGENCVFSPFSIHSALAMTARGAQGNTRQQILQLLALDLQIQDNELDQGILEMYNQIGSQLQISNGLFVDIQFPLSLEYELALQNSYKALAQIMEFELSPASAQQLINEFVFLSTSGQISDLIPRGAITQLTRLVLVNAIFYKGTWETMFNEAATSLEPFYLTQTTSVAAPTMYVMGTFRRGSLEDLPQVSFIELPYSGGEMSMFILIPKSLHSMSSFEDSRTFTSIDTLAKQLNNQPQLTQQLLTTGIESVTELYLPKFTVEFESELSEILSNLGMVDAFTSGLADFGGMLEGEEEGGTNTDLLYLSEGYHKTVIIVDEEGTTAAAATGLLIAERSAGIEMQNQFVVDQPFIFMLVNKCVGSTIVMGVVNDPTQN
eukprot:TRINITY_DN6263_c0_g1_i10.p1 TRINITY_DN6263_c0_g1~~TRINITY_DN6263_c0_g1_i10.p1  ORF type:complete len:418 (-),score=49.18 TRINITY_DN6263_c0_g1_i10:11-1264(-)